jgi:hypothetical protein
MTEPGKPDQVHEERIHQQDADHAGQADQQDDDDDVAGRGGALHRLGEQSRTRDADDAA